MRALEEFTTNSKTSKQMPFIDLMKNCGESRKCNFHK